MATKLKQVYLLKECQRKFECKRENQGEYQGELGLFQPQLENFKPFPNEKYEEKEIFDIKNAIDQFSKPLVNNSWLQLVAQYDTFYESYKVMLKVKVNSSFAKKLCMDLVEPKVVVQGTFTYTYFLANGGWRPADDIDLEKEETISDFEGASKMVEICNKVPSGTYLSLKYSVILQWRDTKLHLPVVKVNILEKLFNEKLLADCTITLPNGSEVQCHRNILAAQSDVFHAMLTSGFSESTSYKIEMTDVTEEGFNIFLTYLYKQTLNNEEITEELAIELLQVAHKYNVSPLENIMLQVLFQKHDDLYSIDSALSLYFMTTNVTAHSMLCEKMFGIIKRNSYGDVQKLRSSTLFKELEEKNPKEALNLAFKLLEDAKN
ncbi:unnamed protein product [Orchesella dallaii]|uniref:BTB domain-containing protein n=1 Tax=Orchesella dallaii TaxID=48710 RepID=A0ABP1RMJ5_9HEXA